MRVEQEQKVTEDARISAEQDAAAQRYAANVLQVLHSFEDPNICCIEYLKFCFFRKLLTILFFLRFLMIFEGKCIC